VAGRSYITYVFKDAEGNVTYLGRASGPGNPIEVLQCAEPNSDRAFSQIKTVVNTHERLTPYGKENQTPPPDHENSMIGAKTMT
jgi:hypothetical protein